MWYKAAKVVSDPTSSKKDPKKTLFHPLLDCLVMLNRILFIFQFLLILIYILLLNI